MRFIHQGGHFHGRELRSVDFVSQRKNAAGNSGFDDIGAVLHLESNSLADLLRTIGNALAITGLMAKQHVTKASGTIEMATRRADSEGCYQHEWADNYSFVDRVSQGDVNEFGATNESASESAHCGRASLHSC